MQPAEKANGQQKKRLALATLIESNKCYLRVCQMLSRDSRDFLGASLTIVCENLAGRRPFSELPRGSLWARGLGGDTKAWFVLK